jgi:hypothetical protein
VSLTSDERLRAGASGQSEARGGAEVPSAVGEGTVPACAVARQGPQCDQVCPE